MVRFLVEGERAISKNRRAFIEGYLNAYQVLAATARGASKSELVPQEMWRRISSAPFESLVEDLRMRNEADEIKKELDQK